MSKRLTVAVDCDDVLIESAVPMVQYYNQRYGTNLALGEYYESHDKADWGTDDQYEIGRRLNSYLDTPEHMQLGPVQETIEVLQRLRYEFDLHIVTGRPSHAQAATLAWLEHHLPDVFQKVVFVDIFTGGRSKGEVCYELGAHFLVDDLVRHCESVASVGMQALLFGDLPWNKDYVASAPNIRRVANWTEVEKVLLDARSA